MNKFLSSTYLKPLVAMIILAVSIAWLAGGFNDKMPASSREHTQATGAQPLLVEPSVVTRTEQIAATISPLQDTVISARILARISQIHVRAGDRVEQGQLLVSLEQSELQARVAQLKQQKNAVTARLSEAKKLLARAVELHEKSLLSTQELDKSQANFDALSADESAAQESLNQAQTNLSFAQLNAPISGVVIERLAEPGNTAQPGTPLLSIYNPNSLQVEAYIREQLVIDLKLGDKLQVAIPSINLNTSAQITEIVPAANIGARSFLVKASVDSTVELMPGMFAKVLVSTHKENIVKIPENYIQSVGQLTIVTVQTDNSVSRRFVRLGQADELGDIEIISGLVAGETIVLPTKS